MKNILLVGNGPSVKDQELGELIDSYDRVVRFNWYHTEGYEKYVGAKTDIWFTTVADPVRAKKSYDLVYWHSWNWDARSDKNYITVTKVRKEHYPEAYAPIKTFALLVGHMSTFMNDARGNRIKTMNHAPETLQSWSTGSIAAWWFLNNKNRYPHPGVIQHLNRMGTYEDVSHHVGYDQVHLYGFDWWDMNSDSHHHLGDSQTVGRNHNPQQELEFFTYLWEMGKIHDLHPDSQFHYPPIPPDE
jgi:hypothetical protein